MPYRSFGLSLLATVFALVGAAAAVPLDITDTASRPVEIAVESSSNLAAVGQTFGPAFPATYSVAGGIGTVLVSAETHAQMRPEFLPPVPGTFTPFVIAIDLTTLHASSETASGAYASGVLTSSFTLHPLASDAMLGFLGPILPPLACSSQQAIDEACLVQPLFCGETCTLVSGAAYAPSTGKLNLVGVETVFGCDGALCFGPFDYFARQGDVLLSEAPIAAPVPGLSGGAMTALILLLPGAGWRRRCVACRA